MQREVNNLPDEITKATRALRQESERLVVEERRASSKAQARCQVRNKIYFSICFSYVVYAISHKLCQ